MKLIVIVMLVYICRSKMVVESSAQAEKYIRNRGTFSVAAVKFDHKSEQEQIDPKTQQLLKDLNMSYEQYKRIMDVQDKNQDVNLFDNQQIELPDLCKPDHPSTRLSLEEYTSLVYAGEGIQKCWIKAAKQDENNYDYSMMPFLNAVQFAQFYQCTTQDRQRERNMEYIQPEDGINDPYKLLAVVNHNDILREDISWLEAMVYTCTKGQMVRQSIYMDQYGEEALNDYLQQGYSNRQRQRQAINDRDTQMIMQQQISQAGTKKLRKKLISKLLKLRKQTVHKYKRMKLSKSLKHQIRVRLSVLKDSLMDVFTQIYTKYQHKLLRKTKKRMTKRKD